MYKAAETLYTKGFISYPRTETDQFDNEIDLKKLVEKQYPSEAWGEYARGSVFSTNTILAEFHTNLSRSVAKFLITGL